MYRSGGATGVRAAGPTGGGAKVDTGLGSTGCSGADIDVSHEIPEFIGNTSGIGA